MTLSHPAKFSQPILDAIGVGCALYAAIRGQYPVRVLDPFAGVGGIHSIANDQVHTLGVELEPEWAEAHERTLIGDARHLPRCWSGFFDVVATSPAYGNRMADAYDGRDGSKRMTYRLALGRPLTPESGAGMQWGKLYRHLHASALHEMYRVLKPGGMLLLNLKDHIRQGEHQHVPHWWIEAATAVGFSFTHVEAIETQHYGFGANAELRCPELIVTMTKRDQT